MPELSPQGPLNNLNAAPGPITTVEEYQVGGYHYTQEIAAFTGNPRRFLRLTQRVAPGEKITGQGHIVLYDDGGALMEAIELEEPDQLTPDGSAPVEEEPEESKELRRQSLQNLYRRTVEGAQNAGAEFFFSHKEDTVAGIDALCEVFDHTQLFSCFNRPISYKDACEEIGAGRPVFAMAGNSRKDAERNRLAGDDEQPHKERFQDLTEHFSRSEGVPPAAAALMAKDRIAPQELTQQERMALYGDSNVGRGIYKLLGWK